LREYLQDIIGLATLGRHAQRYVYTTIPFGDIGQHRQQKMFDVCPGRRWRRFALFAERR